MADKFLFSITTAKTIGNRSLITKTPDKYGYYTQAGAVINHSTENSTYYDPEIFRTQMVDKNNIFNKNLIRGCLYGEADHPDVPGTMEDIPRLLTVKMDRVSHHIREVTTVPLPEVPGAYLVLLKVKPHGKYGEFLKDSLESEFMNTSFSLRSIIKERWDAVRKLKMRNILQLVTFDWITVGGSPEASKRFSSSNMGVETYSRTLSTDMLVKAAYEYGNVSGMESSDSLAIQRMLGDLEIRLSNNNYELSGFKEPGCTSFVDANTTDRKSLTHLGFKNSGGVR